MLSNIGFLKVSEILSFFHRVANIRRKFNAVQSICVDGVCFDDISSVNGAIVNFTMSITTRIIHKTRTLRGSPMILFQMMTLVIS